MDNYTHTIIGLTVAGVAARVSRRTRERAAPDAADGARATLLATAWAATLASNLPDVDLFLPPAIGNGRLGYLLHHRGWTHTLLALPVLALVATVIGLTIAGWIHRRRGGTAPVRWRASFAFVFAFALVGALLHLVADSWNDYGVHPYAPWSGRWVHGDAVFIIEPLIWGALSPYAWFRCPSRVGRALVAAPPLLVLALAWGSQASATPLVPAAIAAWITLWLAASAAWQRRRPSGPRALAQLAVVLLAFAVVSARVRGRIAEIVAHGAPGERIVDVIRSPSPANPLCWRIIVVSRDAVGGAGGVDTYRARVGAWSFAPALLAPRACVARIDVERTAPLAAPSLAGTPELAWVGEFAAPVAELKRLAAESCRFRALLKFARAPFWVAAEGAPGTLVGGDLRYDFEKGLGFSELDVSPGAACNPSVSDSAPWDMPAGALLE